MKKTSRILSAALALAMVFALAVPAFADDGPQSMPVTYVCDCTVPPIGTVRYYTGAVGYYGNESWEEYEEYSVFDQAVTFTLTSGRRFLRAWRRANGDELGINQDGSVTFPAGAEDPYRFSFEVEVETDGGEGFWMDWIIEVWPKAYLDQVLADGNYRGRIEYIPNSDPTAPAQPAAPAQPTTPGAATAVKPAPGVSVPLADGSGEFLYTVKRGDTLRGLAAYYYGDENVYKLIYERNKGALKSPGLIYAGQAIILPSYAAVAAARL